jgi:hypothetical protein
LNWQDFETLCLKLWGEIWQIPHEIEFNSDNAQGQQGVDIYGPVNNGMQYYGVQCKNKKLNLIDGSPNRLTIKDVQTEIDKAIHFKPALNKLIIATSLPKDQKVEEYVRVKSLEQVQNGLFTIQICFWEFFERKIPEFQYIYDWYLKNENFLRTKSMSIVFSGGKTEEVFYPKFQKNILRYTMQKELPEQVADVYQMLGNPLFKISDFQKSMDSYNKQRWNNLEFKLPEIEWEQYCWFSLYFKNTGQAVIEDFKIKLNFEGDFIAVGAESGHPVLRPGFKTNVKEYSDTYKALYIKPFEPTLVQGDGFSSGSIYLKPAMECMAEIKLHWKLIARDFEDSGTIIIKTQPKYHTVIKKQYVNSKDEERDEQVISLVKRKGSYSMLPGQGQNYMDKESDYKFE